MENNKFKERYRVIKLSKVPFTDEYPTICVTASHTNADNVAAALNSTSPFAFKVERILSFEEEPYVAEFDMSQKEFDEYLDKLLQEQRQAKKELA